MCIHIYVYRKSRNFDLFYTNIESNNKRKINNRKEFTRKIDIYIENSPSNQTLYDSNKRIDGRCGEKEREKKLHPTTITIFTDKKNKSTLYDDDDGGGRTFTNIDNINIYSSVLVYLDEARVF